MKQIPPCVAGAASDVVAIRFPYKRFICANLLFGLLRLAAPDAFAVGATTPFQCVEAESGSLAGGATLQALTVRPTSSLSSATLEASGHAYVQLNAAGQSVTLTNNTGKNINALNLRYSIPDAPGGGGINATLNLYVNGIFRQAVNLTSTQSWCYQAQPSDHGWNQSPSAGQPHIFYDESHFFITGAAVPAGGTIMFRKDSANSASFYWLDVIDMEAPPAALAQPANSLSITSYGAVANNPSFDSEPAIQNCINAAQSQGKSVWIPQGKFYLSNSTPSLSATGVTIEGAGMWYSVIQANPALPATPNGNILYPTSCIIRNLAFDSNSRGGGSGDGQPGGLNVKGSNWLVENVWIQHMGAGIWANGVNGTIRNCRTGSTWADGININNGNGAPGNGTGNNLTVTNCFVRGSGDDGIAINSGGDPGTVQMESPSVTSCTVVAPWWANNIGIYGGNDMEVWNNLCTDSVGAYGISIGQFGSGGRPVQSGLVADNLLIRCGSYGFYNQGGVPALNVGTTAAVSNANVDGNVINHSMFMAIGLEYCGANVTVQNNTAEAPGTTGVFAYSHATGAPFIRYNAVLSLSGGQSAYVNNAGAFTPSLVGNTWNSPKKLVIGSTRWLRADANSKYVCADNGGNDPLIANRSGVGPWEQFVVVDAGGGKIALRAVANNKYVCPDNGGSSPLIANRTAAGPLESFIEIDGGSGKIGLRALTNNKYVCAENGGTSPLVANRTAFGLWETFTVGP
ncbi:MAG: right-handed parallel beta-helix repeat-containing protein [Verrucomicrobiota bacterium]